MQGGLEQQGIFGGTAWELPWLAMRSWSSTGSKAHPGLTTPDATLWPGGTGQLGLLGGLGRGPFCLSGHMPSLSLNSLSYK